MIKTLKRILTYDAENLGYKNLKKYMVDVHSLDTSDKSIEKTARSVLNSLLIEHKEYSEKIKVMKKMFSD